MALFWKNGYTATSMDDLVRVTGASRHGIYSEFGGKRALFVAGFSIYQRQVVTPAFAQVEQQDAGFPELARYFEQQISLAASLGLPGPGCLVANTMTEKATHDKDVMACVSEHLNRLRSGFANSLKNESFDVAQIPTQSELMVVFTQGLWSTSRVTDDANQLRNSVTLFLSLVKQGVN